MMIGHIYTAQDLARMNDPEVAFIDVWFDHVSRSWVTQVKNAADYEVGPAIYDGHIDTCLRTVEWTIKAHPKAKVLATDRRVQRLAKSLLTTK